MRAHDPASPPSLARAAAVIAALAALAPAAAASASSAAVLPRVGGTGVSEAAIGEARDAAAMVLGNEGWRVHDASEVESALAGHLAACGPEDDCAHELRATLAVDVVVGLRLWGDGERVERLAVVVTGARGVGHRALAAVSDESPLPFAMAEALRAALLRWSTGAVPDGARGVTEPSERTPAPMREELSPLNWVLGGLFVLGSAPMLGYGINTAVRDGDCLTEGAIPGTCVEQVRFGDGAAVFTALGAITFATGLVFLITQPIRVQVQAGPDSASLTARGTF